MKRRILLLACILSIFEIQSQVTNLTTSSTLFNEFLGWSGGVQKPLVIRNDFDDQITFHTNNFMRMVILTLLEEIGHHRMRI